MIRLRDSWPGIVDFHADPVTGAGDSNRHPSRRSGVAHRVLDKVVEDALDDPDVADHLRNTLRRPQFHGDPSAVCRRLMLHGHIVHEFGNLERLRLECHLTGFYSDQIQSAFHQPCQPAALLQCDGDTGSPLRSWQIFIGCQQFQMGLQRR